MMGDAGVTPVGLSTLFVIWSATVVALEVPSGGLADRVSRKWLLVIANLTQSAAFACWLLYPSYWGFACGFIIWGAGSSLASGTTESLLHDILQPHKRGSEFEKMYGRGVAARNAGVAVALALGGWAAVSGYSLPLILSCCAPFVAALIVVLGISEPPRSGGPVQPNYRKTLVAGLNEVRGNIHLIRILVSLTLVVAVYGTLDEYLGPLLAEQHITLADIGLIYAFCLVARIAGTAQAYRFCVQKTSQGLQLFACACALLFAVPFLTGYTLGVLLAVFSGVSAIVEVILQGRLQRAIAGSARATITSVAGMGEDLLAIGLFLLIGFTAGVYTWTTGFVATACLSIVASILLIVHFKGSVKRSDRDGDGDRDGDRPTAQTNALSED